MPLVEKQTVSLKDDIMRLNDVKECEGTMQSYGENQAIRSQLNVQNDDA